MTDTHSSHPDAKQLQEFAMGMLDEIESKIIETHLTACDHCCRSISSLESSEDQFVSSVRKALLAPNQETNANPTFDGYQLLRSLSTKGPAEPMEPIVHTNTKSTDPSNSKIPKKIGRFEIRELLGHGAFGVVWRAFDTRLRRDVAIKIPQLAGFAGDELHTRFLREALASASLEHPNILPVYESGEDGEFCYIVSAHCAGPDLANWLAKNGQPNVSVSVRIAIDLAEAIHHAHSRGVIHRDLKPANILLEPIDDPIDKCDFKFTPKITDFGLAKIQDDQADPTRSRCLMGTAGYMSPEMAQCGAHSVGPTSDVYALGALLYELLTGQQPFSGPTVWETLRLIQDVEPTAPSKISSEIPRDLDVIVLTCLQKQSMHRYANARLLQEDLERFLRGEPIAARPASAFEKTWRWCCRNRFVSTLYAAIVLLLAALAMGGTLAAINFSKQRTVITQQLWESHLTNARMTKSTMVGRRTDSLRAIENARELMSFLNYGEREALLLRNHAVAALGLSDLRVERTLKVSLSNETFPIAYDSNLKRFAVGGVDNTIDIRSFSDNQTLVRCKAPQGKPINLEFSPNGQILAGTFEANRQIRGYLWRLNETMNGPMELDVSLADSTLEFVGDDLVIAIESRQRIVVYDARTGLTRKEIPVEGAAGCKVSPSQTQFVIWSENAFSTYSFPNGEYKARFEIGEGLQAITTVSWSDDSQLLAVGGTDHAVYVMNMDESQPRQAITLEGHEHWIESMVFTSIDRLLTSDSGGKMKLWDLNSGSSVLETDGRRLDISSDRKRIAAQSGDSVILWQSCDDRVLRTGTFGLFPYEAYDLVAMRDDDAAVSCTSYGLDFWDLSTLQCASTMQLDPAPTQLLFASRQEVIGLSENRVFQYQISQDENGVDWNLVEPREVRLPNRSFGETVQCQVSDGGRVLVVGDVDGVVLFERTDPIQGNFRISTEIELPRLSSFDVSSDGHWLFAATERGLEQWDLKERKRVRQDSTYRPRILEIGPLDGLLAIADGDDVVLLNNDWKSLIRFAQDQSRVSDFEFSPDGKYIAVVHREQNEIHLFEVDASRLLATISTSRVRPWFTFSSDSRYLVYQGRQFSVAFWDLQETTRQLSKLNLLDQ